MLQWLGRRIARYLMQPVANYMPIATSHPDACPQFEAGGCSFDRRQHPRFRSDQIPDAIDMVTCSLDPLQAAQSRMASRIIW